MPPVRAPLAEPPAGTLLSGRLDQHAGARQGNGRTGVVRGVRELMKGIGTDVVTVSRMTASLRRTPGFAAAVFADRERAYCDAQRVPARHYAARFAAKEGFLKALGLGLWDGVALTDIEVLAGQGGGARLALGPTARAALERAGGREPLLSLTHGEGVALALVVVP